MHCSMENNADDRRIGFNVQYIVPSMQQVKNGIKRGLKRLFRKCRNSFVAGTPVATPSGLVPIETLEPGDLVLCRDQNTGIESVCRVAQTFIENELPASTSVKLSSSSVAPPNVKPLAASAFTMRATWALVLMPV